MKNIDATKSYSLQEIVDKELIPYIRGYAKMYSMVTEKVPNAQKKTGYSRKLSSETTATTIKPDNPPIRWNKISSKITVKGFEILKFLRIHGILNNN